MTAIDRDALQQFLSNQVAVFQQKRIEKLESIRLHPLLRRKNPYMFRAIGIETASDLAVSLIDAVMSSSEETLFGSFLEELALFVAQQTSHGYKSSARGMDIEFDREDVRYLIAIKSGPNWGNSSQYQALERNFLTAKTRLMQSSHVSHVQPVLGMCYGNRSFSDTGIYWKLTGQSFWHFLSQDEDFYLDVVEPIGDSARRQKVMFGQRKQVVYENFTTQLQTEFCDPDGLINWEALITFASSNMQDGNWQ